MEDKQRYVHREVGSAKETCQTELLQREIRVSKAFVVLAPGGEGQSIRKHQLKVLVSEKIISLDRGRRGKEFPFVNHVIVSPPWGLSPPPLVVSFFGAKNGRKDTKRRRENEREDSWKRNQFSKKVGFSQQGRESGG